MALRRMVLAGAAAGSLVALGTLGVPGVALAEVSPHCTQDGYCLFSGSDFTGTEASPDSTGGCHLTSDLGLPVVRSAARGFGDGSVLVLYTDTACTSSPTFVTGDVADTSARSYRVMLVPG